MVEKIMDDYTIFGDALIYKITMEGMLHNKPSIRIEMTAYNANKDWQQESISLEFEEVYFLRICNTLATVFVIYSTYIGVTDEGVVFDFDPDISGDDPAENPGSELIIKAKRVAVYKIPDIH